MSDVFQHAILRELDQIRRAFERAIDELKERDESRDGDVSDLKLQVGLLRGECRRNIKRDAGLVIAPTTITAIVMAVLQAMQGQPPQPPQPQRAPVTVQP